MLTEKNIFSPLKTGLIGLLFVLSNYAFAVTYYVDATNGNDSNNGTSVGSAFKTLQKVRSITPSLSAGDQVLFKRGEIFNGYLGLQNVSGTSSSPITIGAYGTGNRPILRDLWSGYLTWTPSGSGYTAPIGQRYASRFFMDNTEILRSAQDEVVDGSQFVWRGGSYVYINLTNHPVTDKNPNNHTFQYAKENVANNDSVLNISNSHYINIKDIALEGGFQHGLYLTNGSSYVNITSVETGKWGRIGIKMYANPHHILVDSCIIDSHYTLDYAANQGYSTSGTGEHRGPLEGILLHHQAHDVEIKNSFIKNFGHTNLQLFADETMAGSSIYNVNVHHNTLTAPEISYGGRVAFDGNIENCEFSYNLVYDTAVRSQLNGHNNRYHHNIFDTTRNSGIKSYNTGQGFLTSNYSGQYSTGNIYENNLFINNGYYGMHDGATQNNIFRNNIVYGEFYIGMSIEGSATNYNQVFQNNLFYSPNAENKIKYRDKSLISISSFNTNNGYKGDVISGNILANPMFVDVSGRDYRLQSGSPAIGKGAYPSRSDTHTVGATLTTEVEQISSEEPTEEPLVGAFIMTPGELK